MRGFCALFAAAVLAVGCSSESPSFILAGARVDPVHWCPGGSIDAKYDVHATIQARNTTSKTVTIESATADLVLAGVTGRWLEQVGDRYDAGAVTVTPSTIPPGSSAKLDVTIPSSCTSGVYGATQSSSGSYAVTVRLTTSAGAFTVASGNRHEILAA